VLALAGQIPRGADSRREVVHVAIVELADRRDLRGGGVEDAEPVVVRADHTVVVPAQAPVERDAAARLKGVLQVERVVVLEREPR